MGPSRGPSAGYPDPDDMYPEADDVAGPSAGPSAGPAMPGAGYPEAGDYDAYPEADDVDGGGYPDADEVYVQEQAKAKAKEVTAASLVKGGRVTEASLIAEAEELARSGGDQEVKYGYKPPKPSDEDKEVKLPKGGDNGYGDDENGYRGFGQGHVAHVVESGAISLLVFDCVSTVLRLLLRLFLRLIWVYFMQMTRTRWTRLPRTRLRRQRRRDWRRWIGR